MRLFEGVLNGLALALVLWAAIIAGAGYGYRQLHHSENVSVSEMTSSHS
jgi:hypothetical protein